ncbi:FkbM family methyltransferase [Rhizobium sp. SL86]|uniref:FkbM family methyltransferase n=1 Tax=Rhizobium sp. SL86 TaxID=2995148 RepID=UPI002274F4DF|nr:FkbM family methyltransferase [Rhizobium sp. SL86]MCY1669384.1 FkbM family methyltransferase [Rhizobium sp. SL86]
MTRDDLVFSELSPRVQASGEALSFMTSYAQNFEDVMLRRALQDVACGFYVDVGAFSPDLHSVTKHFYNAGWRGINIEPHPVHFGKLCEARDRDINLQIALSDFIGGGTLQVVEQTGMSSLNDDFADFVRQNWTITPSSTQVSTLDAILQQHAPETVLDFLKIDVEGKETEVLKGAALDRNRPRLIVIEATKPMTQEPAWEEWEPGLLSCGYLFAWFDGLNRFYVREEDRERLTYFRLPPCCFDSFVVAPPQE